MMEGLDSLFPDKVESIQCLYEDNDCRHLVQKEIGKKLMDCEVPIGIPSFNQIVCIISVSPFATSETECVDVASAVIWSLNKTDILPLVSKYSEGKCNQLELANSCLISLAFF